MKVLQGMLVHRFDRICWCAAGVSRTRMFSKLANSCRVSTPSMKVAENLFLPTSLHVDVFNGAGNSEDGNNTCPVWTADHGLMMAIRTRKEGLNMGRAYLFHFEAHLELEAWMAHIQQNIVQAEREEGMSKRFCVRGVERKSEFDKKKLTA